MNVDKKEKRSWRRRRALSRFYEWRIRHIGPTQYMIIISVVVGAIAAITAAVLKTTTHAISSFLDTLPIKNYCSNISVIYPFVGIAITVIFIKLILKQKISGGIPRVLYSISKEGAVIKSHNMYSSVISSAITVGFGGSAGLEGPTVVTGAAIGSNIGRFLHLNFKQRLLMLGCATAAALSAIFKAPITGVVFVLEVFMLDLTMNSLVPLLISSVTGVLLSYMMMGSSPVYFFRQMDAFSSGDVPYFVLLGLVCALSSIYFTRSYIWLSQKFRYINSTFWKLIWGCLLLVTMIYLFPSLYGEGYEIISSCLNGDCTFLFKNSLFSSMHNNNWNIAILLGAIILVKPLATSTTFAAGGVGGIFAPSLFVGANTGLLLALVLENLGFHDVQPQNFALVGMAGTIAGVLHAPLTAVFLIAELTGGYKLFVPLMLVSILSYIFTKKFITNSIYTYQLARRNELLTHHTDKNVLNLMKLDKLLEKNFAVVYPEDTLRVLVKAVEETTRNVFAVVSRTDNTFIGIIKMDDIRKIMFHPEEYDKVFVKDLCFRPDYTVRIDESMDSVATKFSTSDKFNIAVLDENNKYLGFVSRAKVFSTYRRMSKQLSED
ncbi:MAG: chloride channel protein [Bacteroidales bacterium]|nr:chloride channel protein [Bacteroidales bacterium]